MRARSHEEPLTGDYPVEVPSSFSTNTYFPQYTGGTEGRIKRSSYTLLESNARHESYDFRPVVKKYVIKTVPVLTSFEDESEECVRNQNRAERSAEESAEPNCGPVTMIKNGFHHDQRDKPLSVQSRNMNQSLPLDYDNVRNRESTQRMNAAYVTAAADEHINNSSLYRRPIQNFNNPNRLIRYFPPTNSTSNQSINMQQSNVQPTNMQPSSMQPINVQPTNMQSSNMHSIPNHLPVSNDLGTRRYKLQKCENNIECSPGEYEEIYNRGIDINTGGSTGEGQEHCRTNQATASSSSQTNNVSRQGNDTATVLESPAGQRMEATSSRLRTCQMSSASHDPPAMFEEQLLPKFLCLVLAVVLSVLILWGAEKIMKQSNLDVFRNSYLSGNDDDEPDDSHLHNVLSMPSEF